MNDQLIRDLLHEVADDVEPGDRLDAIRASTASSSRGRRAHAGWWVAGGAGLLAASIATTFALTTGGSPQGGDPDPAAPTSTDAPARVDREPVSAVYLVGDTAAGPRLFREFRQVDGDALAGAVAAAVGGDAEGRPVPPLDPDYRSLWPALTSAGAALDAPSGEIVVSLGGDPEGDLGDRGALSGDEARLAVQALVRTAQGVVGERLPVRFEVFGRPADRVLGVPTADAVTADPSSTILAPVSLSDPSEGLVADNDELFAVRGRGTSSDGRVQLRIQRWEGTSVAADDTADVSTAGRLSAFEVVLDLSRVSPGDYDVIATVTHADGTVDSDTRRITVVD